MLTEPCLGSAVAAEPLKKENCTQKNSSIPGLVSYVIINLYFLNISVEIVTVIFVINQGGSTATCTIII
jgi:hypothetical protein